MKLKNKTYLLIALMLALSGCGGKEERKAEHMAKGKAYLEQADYEKARIEFKNVLQIDPKNADAYYMSGLLEEKQQQWQRAFGNYMKALELNPQHLEAKAKVGKFYLLSGDTVKAEKMITEILAKKPGDPAAHTLKAALMARKGDMAGAIQEASQVIAADPTQTDAVSLIAALYSKQGDNAKAQDALENGIKANPKNVSLRMDLVSNFLKQNELAKAEQQMVEIITLDPKKLEYRINLATFYARSNQLDKAEKTLRELIQVDPKNEEGYLLLTEFLATKKSAEQAEKELLANIQAMPKAYKLRFGLAKLYQATNNPDKMRQTYQEIIDLDKTGPEGLKARNELASLDIQTGKPEEAGKLVAEVLKENPKDNQALLFRGQMSLAKGDANSAISDFRSVLKDQPDSVPVISLLVRAHTENKEPQLAKSVLSDAIAKYPENSNVRMAMADYLAATQDFDGALREVDAAMAADPKNLRALQAKAEIQAAKRDWPAAEATMSKLKAALPEQPLGYYRLGLIYQAQKKYDQALAEFELALSKAPKEIEPLTAMVNVLMLQGKGDKAVARINQVIQATPDNFMAHLLLGEVYVNQKKPTEAEGEFHKAIQINPKVSAGYLDLANLSRSRGDTNAAIQFLQQGIAAIPGDARLSVALAELYQLAGNNDKAIAEYDSILKKNPGLDVAANNMASLLTDKGDKASLDKALELAKRFENSANPAFADTLGWIYFKSNQTDNALPLLQKAADKAPEFMLFQYHLGMALYKKGDMKGAKIYLQKAVDSKSTFPGLDEAKGILSKL